MHVALAGPASPEGLRGLLQVRPDEPLPLGLGGTPVTALARALVDAGHRVTLVTLSPDISAHVRHDGPSLSISCFPWRTRARARAADLFRAERSGLRRGIRASGASVVHAHWTYEYAWAALSSGLPTLVTVHDAPVTILRHHPDPYRLLRLAMAARVRASGVALSAVSPYAADRWRQEMLDRREVAVVPNIAPTLESPTPHPTESSVRHVVVIGSAAPLKNVAAAVAAFRLLGGGGEQLRLRVIGPGLGPEDALARRISSAGGVDFLGPLPAARVHEELHRAAVLLHPSLEETQGMVLLEAMQARVPVIGGRDSGGVPWTLDGGAAGVLVDVTDPAAMAAQLVRLLEDDPAAREYVERASALVQSRFSSKVITDAYVRLYARIA